MNTVEEKLEHYREQNRFVKKGRILFVGSSLMEMFPVEKLLKEAGYEETVYNRGIGGYTCKDLLETLDVCVLDLVPRRIFINIGTNDLTNPDLTVDEIMEQYEEIIHCIEEHLPQAEIYMMAYYPVNYEAAAEEMKPVLKIRTNEKITLACEQVKKIAEKHHCRYIDVNEKLKDEKGRLKAEYTLEGLHINEEGYRALIPDLLPYVKEESWKK